MYDSGVAAVVRWRRSPRIRAIPNAVRPKCSTRLSMDLEHWIHETMSDYIEGRHRNLLSRRMGWSSVKPLPFRGVDVDAGRCAVENIGR